MSKDTALSLYYERTVVVSRRASEGELRMRTAVCSPLMLQRKRTFKFPRSKYCACYSGCPKPRPPRPIQGSENYWFRNAVGRLLEWGCAPSCWSHISCLGSNSVRLGVEPLMIYVCQSRWCVADLSLILQGHVKFVCWDFACISDNCVFILL